jgi:hypothetical protein
MLQRSESMQGFDLETFFSASVGRKAYKATKK